jgi:hypothetical protein
MVRLRCPGYAPKTNWQLRNCASDILRELSPCEKTDPAAQKKGTKMKRTIRGTSTILSATLLLAGGIVQADETDTLIELDKKWGETRGADDLAPLLSDDVMAVTAEGADGKDEMLADADANPPPEGPYQAADYHVKFLSDDTAIMTHSSGGEDPHHSLHVWQKIDGHWKVAATAAVPVAE